MAHELDNVTGSTEKAVMIGGGTPAWHGLGTVLEDDVVTAEKAMEVTGLDKWQVVKRSISVILPNGETVTSGRKKATVRDDRTGQDAILGYVGTKYRPIQNADCFKFFDGIVGRDEAIYHTAGALKGGRWVWLLARLPGTVEITEQDHLEQYLLLANAHDGTEALTVRFTPVRVVCNNTLTAALRGAKNMARVLHMGNVDGQFREAQRVLGFAKGYFTEMTDVFRHLAATQITTSIAKDYFLKLVPDNTDAKFQTRTKNIRSTLEGLFEKGRGQLDQAAGTAWGAWNAVTEYIDHHRMRTVTPEKRMTSSWVGSGATMRQEAFNEAVKLMA